jgi:hypothetical protein
MLVDQAALPHSGDKVLEQLSILRPRANRLVWLDSTDSSGETQFEVLDVVDLYTKRHLLKDVNAYTHPSSTINYFEDYYESLLEKLEIPYFTIRNKATDNKRALAEKDVDRIRLSWTFAYTDVTSWNRWTQIKRNFRGGYPSANPSVCDLPLESIGAFFTSETSDIRGAVRKIALDQASIHNWKTMNSKLTNRLYLNALSSVGGAISPFGHGEMTYRDFEVAWFGSLLFKPSVEHLYTFPNVLTPWETYIPLSWNPLLWGSEVAEGSNHENAKQIRDTLHSWSSSMGGDACQKAFITHFYHCILTSQKCGLCEPPP